MNNNDQQYEESQQQVTYAGATATAVVSEDQQNRPLVSNVADFYTTTNPYVYVPDGNLMPTQALPANFFPPAAYFPTGTPGALDFLWTPWPFEMVIF